MASQQSAAIDTLFDSFRAAMAANPTMSLDELRDLLEKCGDLATDPGQVDYFDVDADGTPCLWAVPHGCAEDRVLLALHGGGCVTGSRFSHRKMFAHIAKKIGCRALILDYQRAPEHTHPSQVNEAVKVYEWLLQQGVDAKHVLTVGDSAGGMLCTTVVLAARERNLPLPAGVMALSPWYDMEATAPSFETNAAVERLITRELSLNMAAMFLGEASPKDPLANVMYADFRDFPPTCIQVGGYEVIVDDSLRIADRMRDAGVTCSVEVFPQMQHVFQFMAGRAPEADEAIRKLAAWAKPKLSLA
jgi:epsilon-lactone hydrolase